MPWPQTGATHYHVQLGLPDKGRAIKELVVCNSWDQEPLDLLEDILAGFKASVGGRNRQKHLGVSVVIDQNNQKHY